MKSLVIQLPTVLGALAAMLVSFLSLLSGTPAGACMAKAGAAFLVFAGFGLVLRFAILESGLDTEGSSLVDSESEDDHRRLEMIVPGASVADLLGDTGAKDG